MDNIFAVLGSSAFGVIITLLFNWAQNRKSNSLSYITEERKVWREKIRDISLGIAGCEYEGKGDKNIDRYLIQLQMNINTYGKTSKTDYLHDGHIWGVIDEIKNAKNKKSFDNNKELLLTYLSLMLKENWERTKREVRGYSDIIKYIGVYAVIFLGIAIYYFYILKLKNILIYIGAILAMCLPVIVFVVNFIDEMNRLKNQKAILSIKDIMHNEKKIKKIYWGMIVYIIIYILSLAFIFSKISDLMVNQMKYYTNNNGSVHIFYDLNEHFFPNFETQLEDRIGKRVERVDNSDEIFDSLATNEYDKEIEVVINSCILPFNELVFAVLIIALFTILGTIVTEKANRKKMENEIEKISYLISAQYNKDRDSALIVLDKIVRLNFYGIEELLGFEYKLLKNMERFLYSQIKELDIGVKDVPELEDRNKKKQYLQIVEECIKLVKNLQKSDERDKKSSVLSEVRKKLQEIKLEV